MCSRMKICTTMGLVKESYSRRTPVALNVLLSCETSDYHPYKSSLCISLYFQHCNLANKHTRPFFFSITRSRSLLLAPVYIHVCTTENIACPGTKPRPRAIHIDFQLPRADATRIHIACGLYSRPSRSILSFLGEEDCPRRRRRENFPFLGTRKERTRAPKQQQLISLLSLSYPSVTTLGALFSLGLSLSLSLYRTYLLLARVLSLSGGSSARGERERMGKNRASGESCALSAN